MIQEVDQLEVGIRKAHGAEELEKWKREEADFRRKVVNMENHKDLVNPYELSSEKRELTNSYHAVYNLILRQDLRESKLLII